MKGERCTMMNYFSNYISAHPLSLLWFIKTRLGISGRKMSFLPPLLSKTCIFHKTAFEWKLWPAVRLCFSLLPRELLTAVNSVTEGLDFAGCSSAELELLQLSFLERKQASSEQTCRAISIYTVLEELPPICTDLNTYYIFNSCLRDASSRQMGN